MLSAVVLFLVCLWTDTQPWHQFTNRGASRASLVSRPRSRRKVVETPTFNEIRNGHLGSVQISEDGRSQECSQFE